MTTVSSSKDFDLDIAIKWMFIQLTPLHSFRIGNVMLSLALISKH